MQQPTLIRATAVAISQRGPLSTSPCLAEHDLRSAHGELAYTSLVVDAFPAASPEKRCRDIGPDWDAPIDGRCGSHDA